jgi:hypothetical protein
MTVFNIVNVMIDSPSFSRIWKEWLKTMVGFRRKNHFFFQNRVIQRYVPTYNSLFWH